MGDLLQDNISLFKRFIRQVFFNNNRIVIVVNTFNMKIVNRTVLQDKHGEVWL